MNSQGDKTAIMRLYEVHGMTGPPEWWIVTVAPGRSLWCTH